MKDALLGFKSKTDPPPPGSNLAPDLFILMIQTPWQKAMFQKHGEHLLCIDATHNVSMYENLNLTTLVVRDKWKHGKNRNIVRHILANPGTGIPVAWMLASNGCQETIYFFLKLNRVQNPSTIPRRIMSDFDWPQINGCTAAYSSLILLCWWHVLHAWQQHFHISTHPDLWTLLKKWIRITEQAAFNAAWNKIQTIAPDTFVAYLKQYWMKDQVVRMWSGVHRNPRSLLEESDTNMLIEAYVLPSPMSYPF